MIVVGLNSLRAVQIHIHAREQVVHPLASKAASPLYAILCLPVDEQLALVREYESVLLVKNSIQRLSLYLYAPGIS